ncbi:MAG: hypothetical protein CYPHOPRED_000182 [Cyphobasidiales sp. Tagirdzhanova-0007]|nr:MAG: hypothetical protein CYPHOPRED_000182 [Cyphobasidiales sp. Tagirdzhanova-0007]
MAYFDFWAETCTGRDKLIDKASDADDDLADILGTSAKSSSDKSVTPAAYKVSIQKAGRRSVRASPRKRAGIFPSPGLYSKKGRGGKRSTILVRLSVRGSEDPTDAFREVESQIDLKKSAYSQRALKASKNDAESKRLHSA